MHAKFVIVLAVCSFVYIGIPIPDVSSFTCAHLCLNLVFTFPESEQCSSTTILYRVPHGSFDWCALAGMSELQFLISFLHHPTFKLEWTLNPHVVQMLGVLHFIEIYTWPLFAASLYNSILWRLFPVCYFFWSRFCIHTGPFAILHV